MEEKKYRIGEVSKMLDVSVPTIRFLETTGLITPEKDKWNNYRYYQMSDVDIIMNYKKYRQIGFTSNQTVQVLKNTTLEELKGLLEEKTQEAKYIAVYQNEKMRKLENLLTVITQSQTMLGRFLPLYSPENYSLYTRSYTSQGVEHSSARELGEGFVEMTSHYPFVEHTYQVEKSWLLDPGQTLKARWGLTMKRRWIDILKLKTYPEMEWIPARYCLFTILKGTGKPFLDNPWWQELPGYLQGRGWEITGNVNVVQVFSVQEEGEHVDYLEVWIPVHRGDHAVEWQGMETDGLLRSVFSD